MRKDKQLLERESMERNLQRLLRQVQYKSCGSDAGDDLEENPVNPFMKRVFQKKLRKSSVASENIDPNSSLLKTQQTEETDTMKVRTIIQKGHQLLTNLQKSVIAELQQTQRLHPDKKHSRSKSMIIQNLEMTMQQIESYISKNHKMTNQNLKARSSVTLIEYYQCPSSPSVTPVTTTSKQVGKNRSVVEKEGKEKKEKNRWENENRKQRSNNQNKSVYESVLEQRRSRKNRIV